MSPWSQDIILPISIVQINKKPYIRKQNTLFLAVGTRRPITSDIITVMDEETPNKISFTVESVTCVSCVSTTGGQVVNAAGHPIKFFSQDIINQKKIFFQHSAVSVTYCLKDDKVSDWLTVEVSNVRYMYKP